MVLFWKAAGAALIAVILGLSLSKQQKDIGTMLERMLDGVLEGQLPNEREALLEAAKRNIQEEHS